MATRKRKKSYISPYIWVTLLVVILIAVALYAERNSPVPVTGSDLTVIMLDVGQADAALIHKDGGYMLIDAGKNSTADELVEALRGYGVVRLELVIGTHPHEDHIGGLDNVIYAFEIDLLLMPDIKSETKTYRDVEAACESKNLKMTVPEAGDTFTFQSAVITVVAPNGGSYKDINNYSIAVHIVYIDTSFLFMGDAEAVSEREILSSGHDIRSDVLKTGHHGSSTSSTADFLEAVSPSIALISCGTGNSYDHPHKKTLDALSTIGAAVYRTDADGTVTLVSDGQNIKVD